MDDNSPAGPVHTRHGDLTLEQIADGLPGTGELMASVSHCFGTAWHAGRAGKWELAAYYTRRVRGLMRTLAGRRPNYASQLDEFVRDGLEPLLRAIVDQDESKFRTRYAVCVVMANRYHVDTGHTYIEWTPPESSPEGGVGLP
jgi:predicted HD phosphohydrolase